MARGGVRVRAAEDRQERDAAVARVAARRRRRRPRAVRAPGRVPTAAREQVPLPGER